MICIYMICAAKGWNLCIHYWNTMISHDSWLVAWTCWCAAKHTHRLTTFASCRGNNLNATNICAHMHVTQSSGPPRMCAQDCSPIMVSGLHTHPPFGCSCPNQSSSGRLTLEFFLHLLFSHRRALWTEAGIWWCMFEHAHLLTCGAKSVVVADWRQLV